MKLDYWQGASGGNKYEQIFYNYYQDWAIKLDFL
jgi:hypothetical protein